MEKLDKNIPEAKKKYVTFVKYDDGEIGVQFDRHRMFIDAYELHCKMIKEQMNAKQNIVEK